MTRLDLVNFLFIFKEEKPVKLRLFLFGGVGITDAMIILARSGRFAVAVRITTIRAARILLSTELFTAFASGIT